MDASPPFWLFFAAAALPVSAAAVVFAIQKARERENGPGTGPRIVPNDLQGAVALLGARLQAIENRLSDLETQQGRRDTELADALDRFGRMTQRLSVRADRAAKNGTENETGDLDRILARRRGP